MEVTPFPFSTKLGTDPTGLLEDGVFIAHHPPGLQYSQGQDWCQRYIEEFAITKCKQQHNRIDLDGNLGQSSIWYVLAAWTESKEWCGTEFGFGPYDPNIYGFVEWGPCSPADDLEIPTEYWPGPGRGTAVVVTGAPWSGNFVAVYYFAGYAYSAGVIPLAVDPATDFGGTGNCDTPPQSWSASAFGGMGLFTDGIYVCPGQGGGGFGPEGGETGICCLGEECRLTTNEECAYMGGEFHPEWVSCDPNPCGIGGLDQDPCVIEPDGSGDYPTIQDAINAGCEIIELTDGTFRGEGNRDVDVNPGSYPGQTPPPRIIRSQSGNPESCIIDCEAAGGDPIVTQRGFVFDSGEAEDTILEGIKIINGLAVDPDG